MKILLIGATGTIGQAVEKTLSNRHQVVRVGRTKGEFQVDMASADSIKRLFERTAPFDAVVCAAGAARFAALDKLKDEDFAARPSPEARLERSVLIGNSEIPRVPKFIL